MKNFQILEASEVKLEDYRNLRLEALREEPQAFGSSYKDQKDLPHEEWQKWLDNYREGKRNWMVFAAIEDKLVGMTGAFQTDEDVIHSRAQIIAVYVTKAARGKGISKLLMKRLLEKLTNDTPVKSVSLAVNIDQLAAVKLYESFDFKIMGKENMVLGDGINHEEYVMEKVL